MLTRLSAVVQDIVVVATGVLKGFGKDRHSVEGFLGVDARGEDEDVGRKPGGVDGDGAEQVRSEEFSYHTTRLAFVITKT